MVAMTVWTVAAGVVVGGVALLVMFAVGTYVLSLIDDFGFWGTIEMLLLLALMVALLVALPAGALAAVVVGIVARVQERQFWDVVGIGPAGRIFYAQCAGGCAIAWLAAFFGLQLLDKLWPGLLPREPTGEVVDRSLASRT